MTRNLASSIVCCLLVSGSLLSLPGVAGSWQQSTEQTPTETAGTTAQKPKPIATRPVAGKTTAAASKPTSTTKAKVDKPGKRFWARIMGSFREVHSVEKKTNK